MFMAEPVSDEDRVTPMGLARAKRMLRLMQQYPFAVVVITEDSAKGFVKDCDPEVTAALERALSDINADA